MDIKYHVGIKFLDLTEITIDELRESQSRIEQLAINNGRMFTFRPKNSPLADVYYGFLQESQAIALLKDIHGPGISHTTYLNPQSPL